MQISNFYAKYPVLYKHYIIFTANNVLYKYDRNTEYVETLLIQASPIKHLTIENETLVFQSEFEGGPDLYSLNLISNQIERLTYSENFSIQPLTIENNMLVFISNEHSPMRSLPETYELNLKTKETRKLEYHTIYSFIRINQDVYVQKNSYGYLMWKNYQGGKKGKIYKNNQLLIDLPGQCICPVYYNNRIYFIYEENDNTNIYSCTTEGQDLTKHTNHFFYKLQNLKIQNDEIIYTQIGQIFIFNITQNTSQQILFNIPMIQPKTYQNLDIEYLTSIDNNEEKLISTIRGNVFIKNLYSGGFQQISKELRYVHAGFIDKKIWAIKDGKETELHIFNEDNSITKHKMPSQKIERTDISSQGWIAYSNHKNEIHIINQEGITKNIATMQSETEYFEWSKDGNYLVYELSRENNTAIVLYSLKENINYYLINDYHHNTHPTIDPDNKFIAFLSTRKLHAKHENFKFDYSLNVKENAFYAPLKDNYNMLTPWMQTESTEKLNLKNIQDKIQQIPIKQKLKNIIAIEDKLIGQTKNKKMLSFSLKTLTETYESLEDEETFLITNQKKSIVHLKKSSLLIHEINEKPDNKEWKNTEIIITGKSNTSLKTEIINIFQEVIWLMEEFYWSAEKISIFKDNTKKYEQFLEIIHTENDLYELLNQVQGEMKTSHSYIYNPYPEITKGYLGVSYKENSLIINQFYTPHISCISNPLLSTNQSIKSQDTIISINNKPVDANTIDQNLINTANNWISLKIKNNEQEINCDLKTLNFANHKKLLYENWIKNNEKFITKNNPNIAYIHINDMMKNGFINFFLKYLNNYNKKAIIIDVRYNTGGHVSTILIEQLYKKQLGLDKTRHFGQYSIPTHSSQGNYVLLINEWTASDGEIFSENFKQLKLGPIIGTRTWGGVIGINPRYQLINNLMTSQPEYGTCFFKTEKEIENYGVTPDIQIENKINEPLTPDYDYQLHKALEIINNTLTNK